MQAGLTAPAAFGGERALVTGVLSEAHWESVSDRGHSVQFGK